MQEAEQYTGIVFTLSTFLALVAALPLCMAAWKGAENGAIAGLSSQAEDWGMDRK